MQKIRFHFTAMYRTICTKATPTSAEKISNGSIDVTTHHKASERDIIPSNKTFKTFNRKPIEMQLQLGVLLIATVVQGAFGFQPSPQNHLSGTENPGKANSKSGISCRMLKPPGDSNLHSSQFFLFNDDSVPESPCIPTAHGLICPETIATMEKNANENPIIQKFVDTYHRDGPLACLSMLSDDDILPHLTRAMRDID